MTDIITPKRSELSREAILTVAIKLAKRDGFNSLTRDTIAAEAGVANGKVNYVFKTMEQLRRAVMRAAVHQEIKPIIAQGLAIGDAEAHKAPIWLKQASLATLMGDEE